GDAIHGLRFFCNASAGFLAHLQRFPEGPPGRVFSTTPRPRALPRINRDRQRRLAPERGNEQASLVGKMLGQAPFEFLQKYAIERVAPEAAPARWRPRS